jgi:hypothetical protein
MLTIEVNSRMSFKEFFEIKLFQTHEKQKRNQLPVSTALMEQSAVLLELSDSFTYDEYELTLINENTHQPQFLKRETIDFELLKLLEMRDSEDYEEKEVADSIKFYEIVREEAELADSKEDYNDLIFEVDCQIYQLSLLKRFLLRKLTQSQRGIRKTQVHSNLDIIESLLNREEEPLNEAESQLFWKCRSLREKHFAFTKRFDGIDNSLRSTFQQFMDNGNFAEKAKILLSLICPQDYLTQEAKRILRKKKAVFDDEGNKVESLMSRM